MAAEVIAGTLLDAVAQGLGSDLPGTIVDDVFGEGRGDRTVFAGDAVNMAGRVAAQGEDFAGRRGYARQTVGTIVAVLSNIADA
ncbi:hypothetical protein, partial [Sulfurirhabdus autotrophica]